MSAATGPRPDLNETMTRLTGPGGPFELREEEVLGTRMRVFRHRARNLSEILADAPRYGDRPYLITADRKVGFAEHARQAASLARVLREGYGVRPGDRVAINGANSPEWILAFWAVVAAGAVAVACNAWWSRREVEYALDHTDARVLLADARRTELMGGTERPGLPLLTLEEDVPRLAGRHPGERVRVLDTDEDDPAVILYTSGTSGRMKGAVHSHRNLASVVEYHRLTRELARAFDPAEPEVRRYLLALPLFHIAGLHNLAVPRMADGNTLVVHQGAFDAQRVLELIERERVTNWGAVPTMAHRILEYGRAGEHDLSSLTAFSLASAPSSPAFKERLRKGFPAARHNLVDSYGLTETATAVAAASPADLAEDPGTLGRPITAVELEIRDAQGRALPEGEEGEICVRSPFTMLGYWEDAEATAKALRADRWFHTGDIGVLREGRVSITGRRSDLILRGGENVYPAEVEAVLAEHPRVRECAVLGAPHPDLGQEVMAFVVREGAEPLTEQELADFVRGELAYFKVPSRWSICDRALPRNATGKVRRRMLEVAAGDEE
ncbi:acyl--CoA ligase [Nocardiopsis sp. HNM0947]|uniref:Acyl--CoA ligase n=1 Tax=Nocardiopsis coralli TaxID=2772213 RepID=A0ABR9PEV6_9ACTN|nr:class I adenylate-forming enzyme family protein [Nocardiopsis coralli]MBE3002383.1 acyl--CoA ligase [Nocardiopsis coralli]